MGADAQEVKGRGGFGARLTMYTMCGTYVLALKTVRAAIPSMVPILAAELGFSMAQQGLLLSSFFQGYFVTMIPAAAAAQRLGGKAILTLCLGGTVGVFAALPTAARLGALGCQLLFVLLGLVQGGFTPGLGVLNSSWIPPEGHEKVWAIRAQTLCGDALCQMLAAVATPWLCRGGRWARACYAYAIATACVTVLWQLLASDVPAGTTSPTPAKAEPEQKKGIDWRIFRLPQVHGLILVWVSSVIGQVSLQSLSPTIFMDRFGLTPLEAGRYIALGFSVNIPGALPVPLSGL